MGLGLLEREGIGPVLARGRVEMLRPLRLLPFARAETRGANSALMYKLVKVVSFLCFLQPTFIYFSLHRFKCVHILHIRRLKDATS